MKSLDEENIKLKKEGIPHPKKVQIDVMKDWVNEVCPPEYR